MSTIGAVIRRYLEEIGHVVEQEGIAENRAHSIETDVSAMISSQNLMRKTYHPSLTISEANRSEEDVGLLRVLILVSTMPLEAITNMYSGYTIRP